MMATQKQAQLAKDKHLNFLDKLGAHAVLIDKVEIDGKKTFAVLAYSDKKLKYVPQKLQIQSGKQILDIPLVITVEEKFKI